MLLRFGASATVYTSTDTGFKLGNFEILTPVGSGGMGQVFRARDLKLGRIVAIKMLRPEIAGNALLLQRFQREAKTLASLNHPHIAQIYGIAESDAGEEPRHGIVLEFVDGDTLEDRIRAGRTEMRDVFKIASQVAEALEAAHAAGIVHRDLKPANVKITPSGIVKVLDFGIALTTTEPAGGDNTAFATTAGTVIGTPGYMSPEQIRGQQVDKRTDVWAFGCLLYELLTGQPAFGGATNPDMQGAVLQKDPDWSNLPAQLPAEIGLLLRRCLRKELSERLRDMGDIRVWLDDALAAPDARIDPKQSRRRNAVPWLVAGAAMLAVAALAASVLRQPPPRVSRLQVAMSDATEISVGYNDRDIAITPDGSTILYIGNGQIFSRPLDAELAEPVFAGTIAFGPITSPDGEWIGFRFGSREFRRVPVTGGPSEILATLDGSMPTGATWVPDGSIILASENPATGLERIPAGGGPVEVLTRPDRSRGEADHLWPEVLPDGRSVLFTITALTGGLGAAQVAILDLQTGEIEVLFRGATHARYVASGHLVYGQAGGVQAVAFDLDRRQMVGTPITVIPDVATAVYGGLNFVVARDGTMAYVTGGAPRTLVWVDRESRETPIAAPARPYFVPALSPDDTRIAVYANDQELDIWLWDLNSSTFRRLTTNPARDALQVWTPDGRRVIFSSDRALARNMFSQSVDGSGAAEQVLESPSIQYPMDVSPDGRRLIFADDNDATGIDLMAVELDGSGLVTPVVQSRFSEMNGTISPDGRWFAYEASDTGRFEIYVRPYADIDSNVVTVSTGGGTQPVWTRNGRELIYVADSGALMHVEVSAGPIWSASVPTVIVREGYFTKTPWWGRSYDVTADGERFLMVKEGGSARDTPAESLIVVQNWFEELKRLAPPN